MGIEVLDTRTPFLLDFDTIIKPVKKTGLVIILQEAIKRRGVTSDINATRVFSIFNALSILK